MLSVAVHAKGGASSARGTVPLAQRAGMAALELTLTLLIMAVVTTALLKVVLLAICWALCWRRLSREEIVLFCAGSAIFTGMDVITVRSGTFQFQNPDLAGLPFYEFMMWGFYLVHGRRLVAGTAPQQGLSAAMALAVAISACFTLFTSELALSIGTGALLLLGLVRFHQKLDIAYAAYFVFLGAVVEAIGVGGGEWWYPQGGIFAGVPFWFIPMWGSVGLLLWRAAVPIVRLIPALAPDDPFGRDAG
jgi:hypothetical protein